MLAVLSLRELQRLGAVGDEWEVDQRDYAVPHVRRPRTIAAQTQHPPDQSLDPKLIYLAIQRSEKKWRTVFNWTTALAALKIQFRD